MLHYRLPIDLYLRLKQPPEAEATTLIRLFFDCTIHYHHRSSLSTTFNSPAYAVYLRKALCMDHRLRVAAVDKFPLFQHDDLGGMPQCDIDIV